MTAANETATVTTTSPTIEALNSLVRGELSAIATYDQAIAAVRDEPAVAEPLIKFASEHRRSAETLKAAVAALGGTPSDSAGAWGAFAKLAQGSANLLGDASTLKMLQEGEEHGLKEYLEALEVVDSSTKKVVEEELVPRQRKHIATLAAMTMKPLKD